MGVLMEFALFHSRRCQNEPHKPRHAEARPYMDQQINQVVAEKVKFMERIVESECKKRDKAVGPKEPYGFQIPYVSNDRIFRNITNVVIPDGHGEGI